MSLTPLPPNDQRTPIGLALYRWLGLLKTSFDSLKVQSDSYQDRISAAETNVTKLQEANEIQPEGTTETVFVGWMPTGQTASATTSTVVIWSATIATEDGDVFLPPALSDESLSADAATIAGVITALKLYADGVEIADLMDSFWESGADPVPSYTDIPPIELSPTAPETLYELKLSVDSGGASRRGYLNTSGPLFVIRPA